MASFLQTIIRVNLVYIYHFYLAIHTCINLHVFQNDKKMFNIHTNLMRENNHLPEIIFEKILKNGYI